MIITVRMTTMVESRSSLRLGQLILENSTCTSLRNSRACVVQDIRSNSSPTSYAYSRPDAGHHRGPAGRPSVAGLEGFEPPTPGFGDRCSSRTELQACLGGCRGTAVGCVRSAATASLAPPAYRVS